jgi:hypothetical protein
MHPHDNTLPGRIDCICEKCGKHFTTFRAKFLIGKGRFCSPECVIIPIETRFWAKVQKTDGCWLWTDTLTDKGYGKISVKTNGKWKPDLAHRVSYELHYGSIPSGLHVCHQCDNPQCVRPDHLFLGTNDDNIQDKMNKGRQMRGTKAKAAKMTEDQVLEIRQRFAAGGITKVALAQEYGIGKPAMGDILNRVTWKHLP